MAEDLERTVHLTVDRDGADEKTHATGELTLAGVVRLIRDASPQDLVDQPLLFELLTLWNERRGARRFPSKADLPFELLRPWLGRLVFMEPVEQGQDMRVRLCGTIVADELGVDLTGHYLSELGTRDFARLLTVLRGCLEAASPTRLIYRPPAELGPFLRDLLILPIGEADEIRMLWIASYRAQRFAAG